MNRDCSCLQHAEPDTCAACIYGVCPGCTFPNEIYCHRHAPTSVNDGRAMWPRVHRSDWCADFESRISLADLREQLKAQKVETRQYAYQVARLDEALRDREKL